MRTESDEGATTASLSNRFMSVVLAVTSPADSSLCKADRPGAAPLARYTKNERPSSTRSPSRSSARVVSSPLSRLPFFESPSSSSQPSVVRQQKTCTVNIQRSRRLTVKRRAPSRLERRGGDTSGPRPNVTASTWLRSKGAAARGRPPAKVSVRLAQLSVASAEGPVFAERRSTSSSVVSLSAPPTRRILQPNVVGFFLL